MFFLELGGSLIFNDSSSSNPLKRKVVGLEIPFCLMNKKDEVVW